MRVFRSYDRAPFFAAALVLAACGGSPKKSGGVDDSAAGGESPADAMPFSGSAKMDSGLSAGGGAAGSSGGAGGGGSVDGGAPKVDAGSTTPTSRMDGAAELTIDATEADGAVAPDSRSGGFVAGGPALPCKAAFCESFESGSLNPAVWSATGGNSVGSAVPYSGTKALHVSPFSGPGSHNSETKAFPAALARKQYGRLFLWIEKAPSPPVGGVGTHHWSMVSPGIMLLGGVMLTKGETRTYLNSYPYGIEKEDRGTIDSFTPHKWNCIEWFFDADQGNVQLWLNSAELTKMAVTGDKRLGNLSPWRFGWTEFHGNATPWEVWIDDIAVDGARVGCDK